MVAMSRRLFQLWSNEPFRRSLIAAVRLWNSAVKASLPQQIQAAGQLEKICEQCGASPGSSAADAETPSQTIDRLLDFPSRRLAVYGSLAPGKKNHHVMAGMQGTWRTAVLRGSLLNQGWGAGQGFPGFLWDGSETPVAAQVFSSTDLPRHWQRLDEFEGAEYQRILVPVETEDGEIEVCNVYELAKNLTTDEHR
jgi:gamma-glutamylcyclotransferase (GGCT)/AIG2-like uncharacterized protein YtfP